jgi:hypothetical protein
MIDASKTLISTIAIGQRFGRLIATKACAARSKGRHIMWQCKCDCGKEVTAKAYRLRHGYVRSCGCLRDEQSFCRVYKHGAAGQSNGAYPSPEYRAWLGARMRCNNSNDGAYANYGGRGITFCEQWNTFERFFADMGPRPGPEYSLERIDNSKGYCPGNVKWGTLLEQANNKRNSRTITLDGQTKTLSQWARHTGLKPGTIWRRLQLGWSSKQVLLTPLRGAA